jgi:drug/metabolite transporter (DMT)-like permease
MTVGSLAIVANDACVRASVDEGLDVYQVLCLRGLVMATVLAGVCRARGEQLRRSDLTPPFLARLLFELASAGLFFAALVQIEFANAQTILMLVPFAVTVIAAVVLKEPVSSRNYLTIALGFLGVLAVIRPVPGEFSLWSLAVVGAGITLVLRELVTRRLPGELSPFPVAFSTAVGMAVMTAVLSLIAGWGEITARSVALIGCSCVLLFIGYICTIETVRVGDLSVSAPFRYTSLIGAVIIGTTVFDEALDALTIIGCTLIVIAGLWAARLDRGTARSEHARLTGDEHEQHRA